MRIAAGVLLILVALIDLVAGLGYVVAGGTVRFAAKSGDGSWTQTYETEARKQGKEIGAEEKARIAKLTANAGLVAGFGAFLLVVVGISIAGAVQLFRCKGPMFVVVAAVLVVVAEIIGAVILRFGFGNVPGLVAAVFALLGARSMRMPKPAVEP